MIKVREQLLQIFAAERVTDLQSLCDQLKDRSARSIFRDLLSEGYFSSFTHAGKYYTLKNIPRFDANGIWFYEEIGFAQFGTLKNTLVKLIENSDAGKTHDELKKQLHIRAHNTLLDLVRNKKIVRKKIENDFIYFSININRSKNQMQNREATIAEYKEIGCPDWIVIEILASIIRVKSIIIDLQKIVLELKLRKILITIEQVENVINQCNLKKTLDSG
jgi:hypothetical protein